MKQHPPFINNHCKGGQSMKKTMYLATILFAVLITAWSVDAQMMGGGQKMMQQSGGQQENMPQVQKDEPFMMHPGMMGCYGMGPGMMMGSGMGPGMMMGGGMGPGMMMGGGMGQMHRHMMEEYGWGPGMNRFDSPEQYEKFLDATKDMRKKMHDLRFEYGEMMRNPTTTMGDLKKMEQEMFNLQKKIMEQGAQE